VANTRDYHKIRKPRARKMKKYAAGGLVTTDDDQSDNKGGYVSVAGTMVPVYSYDDAVKASAKNASRDRKDKGK
jgi:hypothetical protein